MGLEKDINQRTFRSESQKASINIIYSYHWMVERVKNILGEEGLTIQQFNILRILRGSHPEPLSTLQIRERMLDKMSDTSRIVDRLVVKGYVSKRLSKADKRLVDVMITEKGKRILHKIDLKNAQMDAVMNGLNDKELKQLSKLLDKLRSISLLLILLAGLFFCDRVNGQAPPPATIAASPKYEFRAAWVASVDNIDWPSRKGLPVDSQKAEFVRLADMHKQNGMNALIVQIRPATDAFYPSPYEPWSEWLSGTQGKPPVPYYDPLQFMITETHNRGMEFHAWCNPYRAEFSIGRSSISPTHITRIHPEWFLDYDGKKYFDPGNKDVQAFVNNVIRDIVSRYDVDAIHFDDYFYPYRVPKKEFPDNASFEKYGAGMNKDDWRRSNVDSIILMLSKSIREIKPNCQFGISPFGVWRNIDKDPDGSKTTAGQTNYDDLYADILLWLKNDWIDYVAPQLYWEFGHKAAPYEVLLEWWSRHTYGKNCYIGLGIYKAGTNQVWRDRTLIPRQLEALRNTPNIQGAIYFSSKSFVNNPNGWSDSLRNNYYKEPAAVPHNAGMR
jgi:uncharacterized lipoprotein YddW (UPF0748 family)/predicted transcriptional regulator